MVILLGAEAFSVAHDTQINFVIIWVVAAVVLNQGPSRAFLVSKIRHNRRNHGLVKKLMGSQAALTHHEFEATV